MYKTASYTRYRKHILRNFSMSPPKPGRPPSEHAVPAAERIRQFRARQSLQGQVRTEVNVSKGVQQHLRSLSSQLGMPYTQAASSLLELGLAVYQSAQASGVVQEPALPPQTLLAHVQQGQAFMANAALASPALNEVPSASGAAPVEPPESSEAEQPAPSTLSTSPKDPS